MEQRTITLVFEGIGLDSLSPLIGDLAIHHALDAHLWRGNCPPGHQEAAWYVKVLIEDETSLDLSFWVLEDNAQAAINHLAKLATVEEDGLPSCVTLTVSGPHDHTWRASND